MHDAWSKYGVPVFNIAVCMWSKTVVLLSPLLQIKKQDGTDYMLKDNTINVRFSHDTLILTEQ